jgi:hypothetical protein
LNPNDPKTTKTPCQTSKSKLIMGIN